MQSVKKVLAVAAVAGFLGFVPAASAGFTPPTNIAPYLPAANAVTVTKVATIGKNVLYACSMGGGIILPASVPMAQVQILASANCSWQAFRLATVSSDSLGNPNVVNQAQAWWLANIDTPYYGPLLSAAKAAAAKSPVGIAAPKAAAVGGAALPRRR
jgi:hypothetical protein